MSGGVPTVCDHCGWRGLAPGVIGGSVQGLEMTGNRYLCPECGRWARIVDGTYDIDDDVFTMTGGSEQSWREFVEIMSDERWTLDRAQRVERALRSPGHGGKPEHVVEQVARIDPQLGGWLQRMSNEPTVVAATIGLVGVIIAAIISAYGGGGEAPTKVEITQIVEQEVGPAAPKSTTAPPREPYKQSRSTKSD